MSTISRLNDVINSVTNKTVTITAETDLLNEAILDSLDAMVFFMALEETFNIEIPEDDDLQEQGYFKIQVLLDMIEQKELNK